MNEEFRRKLEAKLTAFRDWSRHKRLTSVRLVQYCGVEMVGAIDLAADEVVRQIEGLVCEGFYVDWSELEGRLYLRVWEYGGPEPSWLKVYDEGPLY
jgi:hypothetical protein